MQFAISKFGGAALAAWLVASLRSFRHPPQIFACRAKLDTFTRYAACRGITLVQVSTIFSLCREKMVEVSGIGPESLNNRIKAATCLVPHFNLSL